MGLELFTEQGIYKLATILKSKTAIEVSIRIMDTLKNYMNVIRKKDIN